MSRGGGGRTVKRRGRAEELQRDRVRCPLWIKGGWEPLPPLTLSLASTGDAEARHARDDRPVRVDGDMHGERDHEIGRRPCTDQTEHVGRRRDEWKWRICIELGPETTDAVVGRSGHRANACHVRHIDVQVKMEATARISGLGRDYVNRAARDEEVTAARVEYRLVQRHVGVLNDCGGRRGGYQPQGCG